MSDESPKSADRSDLEIDLTLSFQPAWVKETTAPDKLARMAEKFADDPRRDGPRGGQGRRDDRGGFAGDRRGPRRDDNRGPRDGDKRGPRRDDKRGPRGKDDRRGGPGRRDDRRLEAPPPVLVGWDVKVLPEPRGVEGLTRQIRSTAVAYPLFDLALLVLQQPERFGFSFTRKDGPTLVRVKADGSLWTQERDAVQHAVTRLRETFYRSEKVTIDPPKGSFSCVAVCGLSDTLLGPPNYHDYQDRLRKLHTERFARMPFEAFKAKVRMVKDEELIAKWKEERSTREEFFPLQTPEGTEPVRLTSPAEVERHFRAHLAAEAIEPAGDTFETPGPAVTRTSDPLVRNLTRRLTEELRRFPLPLAHQLGQGFTTRGLQIFKAHENITYVSIARPRFLDRQAHPIAETLSAILTWLEEHPDTPAKERRPALAALRPAPEGGEADRDAALARDLSWLLHEGYVVDYARRGLEAVRRPRSRPEQPQ
jgi:hypothetical protein